MHFFLHQKLLEDAITIVTSENPWSVSQIDLFVQASDKNIPPTKERVSFLSKDSCSIDSIEYTMKREDPAMKGFDQTPSEKIVWLTPKQADAA